jgi:hypothetical protein
MASRNFERNISYREGGTVGARAFSLHPADHSPREVGNSDTNEVSFEPSGHCARGNNGSTESFEHH